MAFWGPENYCFRVEIELVFRKIAPAEKQQRQKNEEGEMRTKQGRLFSFFAAAAVMNLEEV